MNQYRQPIRFFSRIYTHLGSEKKYRLPILSSNLLPLIYYGMDSTFHNCLPNRLFNQPFCRLQNLVIMIMFRTQINAKPFLQIDGPSGPVIVHVGTEQRTVITGMTQEVVKEFTLDCFLCHRIKLRRNWGMADDQGHLRFKDTTLLQFDSRTANFQIFIQPVGKQAGTITLVRHTKQSKPLFDYFLNKLKTLTQ